MSSDLRDRLQGSLAPAYTIDRELLGGGMARVFVAEEHALGRRVVVKVLSPELGAGVSAERFTREVRVAATMQHPCIMPVLSSGASDDVTWYTMPFVEGESLRSRLASGASISTVEALKILRDMASAMTYAHGRGVVHRDIKPDNVLLSGGYAIVADFGIAKALAASRGEGEKSPYESSLTAMGAAIGTPAYMSPEQAAGDAATDHRADIYAWGMVAYELFAGLHPFHTKTTAQSLLAAQMSEVPQALALKRPDLPAAITQLVTRCLEKNPAERPASAGELLSVLDAVTSGETGAGRVANPRVSRRNVGFAIGALVVLLAVAGGIWMRGSGRGAVAPASLAVLPFATLGGDTSDVFFGAGMADELTSALTKVPGVRVASRSAAAALRGKTAAEVGATLRVNTVLEGTVRRAGDRLRVTAQLTSVDDGVILWSEIYERPSANIFAVQDDIATSIVTELRARFAGERHDTTVVVSGTRNPRAHELFLRGRYLFAQRGDANMRAARQTLIEATRLDSTYADAFGSLAMVYAAISDWSDYDPDSASAHGKAAAARALALDPNNADAHAALGNIYLGKDNVRSEREYDLALAADPNSALVYHWRSLLLVGLGRMSEALESLRRAHELDPLAPHIQWTYATMLDVTGDTAESRRQHAQLLILNPRHPQGLMTQAVLHARAGETARALAYVDTATLDGQSAAVTGGGLRLRGWSVQVYALSGQTAKARKVLALLNRDAPRDRTGWGAFSLALGYVALGEVDSTFAAMHRVAKIGPGRLPFMMMNTMMIPLQKDPRWAQVFREGGFEWKSPR